MFGIGIEKFYIDDVIFLGSDWLFSFEGVFFKGEGVVFFLL